MKNSELKYTLMTLPQLQAFLSGVFSEQLQTVTEPAQASAPDAVEHFEPLTRNEIDIIVDIALASETVEAWIEMRSNIRASILAGADTANMLSEEMHFLKTSINSLSVILDELRDAGDGGSEAHDRLVESIQSLNRRRHTNRVATRDNAEDQRVRKSTLNRLNRQIQRTQEFIEKSYAKA